MTTILSRRPTGRRSLATTALAVATVALLSACSGIPTSGPVQRGEPVVEQPGPIFAVLSAGPSPGDGPQDIVGGFLRAQAAGFSESFPFGVARQFLSDSVRNTWDPLKGAVVYASTSSPDFQLTGDHSVRVGVVTVGTLDPSGQFTEDSGASLGIGFELQKNADGQWRISKLPDGLVISKPDFDLLFRQAPIYFPSTDGDHLVPDVRWFSNRSVETQAVRAILGGPSGFLLGSVRKVTPDGVKLSSDAVTVTDNIAQVNLSAEEMAASPADRALLKVQLAAVFQQLPSIQGVRINVGGIELTTPDPPQLVEDPQPGLLPWYIADGHLVWFQGTPPAPVAVPGIDLSTIPEPSYPAIGYGAGGPIFVLSKSQNLMYLPADGTPPRLVFSTGRHLAPPSVDRLGWAWTTETQSSGDVDAVSPGQAQVKMKADLLEGRTVQSLRVSRDGSRLVVVSTSPVGAVEIDVVGIQRQNGTPQKLGDPVRIGAILTSAVSVAWVDEASVAVLGGTATTPDQGVYLVPVGGPTRLLVSRPDAVALAAGHGERALYVSTADGRLYVSSTTRGTPVATGVTYPTFPG